MKHIKKILASVLIGTFALSFAGCSLVEKTPEAKQKSPVVKVNGEKIKRSELEENPRYKQLVQQIKMQYGEDFDKNEQGKGILKEQKNKILDEMVMEKIILQKAKELKIEPKEDELNKEADKKINEIKSIYKNDDKKFEETLKSTGFTKESLKENFKKQIIMDKVINEVTKDVKVTEKEAKDYYNQNQYMFTEKPNKIRASHILVKTQDEAKKVKQRIDGGEDFAKVAKEVSQDPGSKDKGGDLGLMNYSDLDPTFLRAAIALKEGSVSNPVQTQFGFHIIKAVKKEEYPVKPFDKVKGEIEKQLKQQKQRDTFTKEMEKWQKSAKIKKYEKNLM
ncbi:peptidylprolyl isomerase [Clostridium niameyense]|uniref:Foldase protein PrsA n=1 Tax=Clostridium niameyense TaxID=1622073 RepID=A0A6M0RD36_9CLOT|nr:peptidylprolyl isomerase [Clostridium niameyense]